MIFTISESSFAPEKYAAASSETIETSFRSDSAKIPFDQVKDQIISLLNEEKALEAQDKYIQMLENNAKVKYFVEMPKAPAAENK